MLVVADHDQLPVREARTGDPAAWEVLFRRYQMPLYAYVVELVRDPQASLDVVQETFVSAIRHIQSLRNDERFAGWLFGIAHQKCIQLWRRRDRETMGAEQLVRDEAERVEEDPGELLVRQEQEAEFMKLLNDLPAPHRSVLLLHFLEDFSLEEIARITGTQLGTVKSRMHYAKLALRKLLEKQSS
jgi:RNA polymerase sigma-70 factor (ECF subfamily)